MKLADYLQETDQRASDLAALVGCETSTITRFLRGERRPSLEIALRIEQATGGKVSPHDLLTPTQAGAA